MKAGDVILKTQIDNSELDKDLDELIEEVESKGEEAGDRAGEEITDNMANSAKKNSSAVNNVISRVFSKITGLGAGLSKTITSIISAIAGAGVGLGAIVGIIGLIIGAVYVLAKAFEKVFSENEQLKANIKYIIWAVGQALQPAVDGVAKILTFIIKLLVSAIQYTLGLLNMLTGGKLFANAGVDKFAESMKQSEESAGGLSKNLKDAKKQLAGFDEMNVLQDTESGGGGAGGVETPEITMPDFDFGDIEKNIQAIIDKWYEFGNGLKTYFEETDFAGEFGNWGLAIEGVVEIVLGLWEILTGLGEVTVGLIKMIVGLLTGDMDLLKEGFDIFIQGIVHLIDGVYKFMEGIIKAIVGIIWGVITTIHDWFSAGVTWILNTVIKPIADFFAGLWDGMKQGFADAWDNIKNWFSTGVEFIKGLLSVIWNKMVEFGSDIGNTIWNAFKGLINGLIGAVEGILNTPIRAINKLIDVINNLPGISLGKFSTFSLPRLAKGGIVNNPGPGVMMGSYIAGERGPEAVIPLDDYTLDRLGEAFARHTTINATMVNNMNGKVISRELQRIQNENNFAFNR